MVTYIYIYIYIKYDIKASISYQHPKYYYKSNSHQQIKYDVNSSTSRQHPKYDINIQNKHQRHKYGI